MNICKKNMKRRKINMENLKNYNYMNNLSYKEMANLTDEVREKLAYTAKQSLFGQILSDRNNNVLPFDKAYRIRVDILDDMNVVAKCEEIPINEVVLNVPNTSDFIPGNYTGKKLKFKDRIKVLFKGEL